MNMGVLIVESGLSGLALETKTENSVIDFLIIEVNEFLVGRILTKSVKDSGFDCGPAWFWPSHSRKSHSLG